MISKKEMEKKEQYIQEIAKIAHAAKQNYPAWGLRLDDYTLINHESDTKTILGRIGVLTPVEFTDLTKGYNFEIKPLPQRHPWSTEKEEDGIYIEKCEPNHSLQYGRQYVIVKGNKKVNVSVNTRGEKNISAAIAERQPEGVYIYLSDTDEIRLLTNADLEKACDNWRRTLGEAADGFTNEDIINGITDSQALWALYRSGTLIANKVHNGKKPDEARVNHLFTIGIKEYVDLYDPRVVGAYETELDEVANWTR